MTNYADLDTCAAKYADGTIWRLSSGSYWSYPTGPTIPPSGQSQPVGSVTDTRVKAALASRDYVPCVVDQGVVVAVAVKPSDGSTIIPSQAAELGSWGGVPARNFRIQPDERGNNRLPAVYPNLA